MREDAGLREVFRGDLPSVELAAALLEDQGIATTVRYEEAGGLQISGRETPLLPGRSVILLVPSIAESEAKEFLARFEEPEPDYLNELSADVEANQRKRRGVAAFILVILFGPFAIALVSLIVVLVGSLFK
jgi:hypothetical protein